MKYNLRCRCFLIVPSWGMEDITSINEIDSTAFTSSDRHRGIDFFFVCSYSNREWTFGQSRIFQADSIMLRMIELCFGRSKRTFRASHSLLSHKDQHNIRTTHPSWYCKKINKHGCHHRPMGTVRR